MSETTATQEREFTVTSWETRKDTSFATIRSDFEMATITGHQSVVQLIMEILAKDKHYKPE